MPWDFFILFVVCALYSCLSLKDFISWRPYAVAENEDVGSSHSQKWWETWGRSENKNGSREHSWDRTEQETQQGCQDSFLKVPLLAWSLVLHGQSLSLHADTVSTRSMSGTLPHASENQYLEATSLWVFHSFF